MYEWPATRYLKIKIVPKAPFGQEVRKVWRQAAADGPDRRHHSALPSFVGEAQGWAVRIIEVILFECEDMTVPRQPVDDADPPSMQRDAESLDLFKFRIHRCRRALR